MRRFFSRFLLFVLAGVVVFAVVRLASGADEPGAVLAFGDSLDPDRLRHGAFRVEAPARLAVYAVGSFESDSTLGATAWIVRRDSGVVAWRMDPRRAARGRGTLATAADTVAFAPGVYDAYFASYGDPLMRPEEVAGGFLDRLTNLLTRGGRAWHGDADRWRFHVRLADESDRPRVRRLGDDARDAVEVAPSGVGVVWATGPVETGETREYVFEVMAPATVRLRATGEVRDGRVRDGAALLRLVGADTVWAMTARATVPAGGSALNRRADTTLALAPGLYRAVYSSDERHAYDDWTANPPLVPTDWGLTVTTRTPAHVTALDPWGRLPRIASFTCVGPNELREDTFVLPDTTHVLLAALGEVIGSTAYDYAVLLRARPGGGSPEEVWVMNDENTTEAGGASKNRGAEVLLTLAPATYTLRYTSDGSHDCADFNDDTPTHPDRWGATLFALDPAFDLGRVTHTGQPDAVPAPPRVEGEVLVQLIRRGNDDESETTFALDATADLRIYAVGEIVPSDSYDYGWIEDDDGNTVWEMTRANTRPAGGSPKNRLFDGTITLPAGDYTAYYETDGSHAYNEWDQPPPNDPQAWGLTVWRERPPGPPSPPLPPLPERPLEPPPPARNEERR